MAIRLNNQKVLKDDRRNERNNATRAESALWSSLKGKQMLGLKFRRQHSVGVFILDFYCPSLRLGIELDGQHHLSPSASANDDARERFLGGLGIRVIRFENKHVFTDHDDVLATIEEVVKERMRIIGGTDGRQDHQSPP